MCLPSMGVILKRPLDGTCLSLVVAGCVLWTSQQDVALSLLETELGLRAAHTKG